MFKKISTAALALMLAPMAAYATVTFDPATGTGFIGRGDVITYVGKAGLVLNPLITYNDTVTTTWTCSKLQENAHQSFTITQNRSQTLGFTAMIDSKTRLAPGNSNISGYLLFGWLGTPTITGGDLVPGSCPADPSGYTFDEGSLQTTAVGVGGLLFNGTPIPF